MSSNRMSLPRAIGTLIWHAVGGGTKLMVKLLWNLRKAKGGVKKGSRKFYETLVNSGIPENDALEIAKSYTEPAMEILSVRGMYKFLKDIEQADL